MGGSLGEAHADTICRVLEIAERGRIPVVGFVESAGARLQEGVTALGGYGRIFRHHVALSGVVPQLSVICGACAGGGSYAPALTDVVVMTKRASMFLTGPGIVQRGHGRGRDAGGPRRPRASTRRTASASSWPRTTSTRRGSSATCSTTCPQNSGERTRALADGRRRPRAPSTRGCRASSARSTTCAASSAGSSTAGGCSSSTRSGRATSSPGSRGSTATRSGSSPTSPSGSAACSTRTPPRRPRSSCRRCDLFGLPLDRPRRHARVHARHRAGEARRDPPRREARPRVRRGARAAPDGRAPQGLRRRVHRDELARPRRRPRARLAAGGDGRDGAEAGRRPRAPPGDRRLRRPGAGPRDVRRHLRRRAPDRRLGRGRRRHRRGRRALAAPASASPARSARSPAAPPACGPTGTCRCERRDARLGGAVRGAGGGARASPPARTR